MKVVDEIKTESGKEIFTKDDSENLFFQLARGKDVTIEIETSRGKFTVKYPKAKDKLAIGRLIAARHNGLPAASFDNETELMVKMISTLEVVVVDGEAWYKNAKKEKEDWTWEDVPDVKFISELFVKSYTFRSEVEENFRGKQSEGADGIPAKQGNDGSMGNGLFQGLAGSTEES